MNYSKTYFWVFLLLLSSIYSDAQVQLSTDFDVKLGEPYKVIDARSKRYFSVGNNKTLSVKTDRETVFIQMYSYSKNGAKEASRTEYKKELQKGSQLIDIIQTKDKLHYIYEVYDRKSKNYDVFSREINQSKGTLGSAKKVFTSKGKVQRTPTNLAGVISIPSTWSLTLQPRFDIITSFNKEKILIRYRNVPEKKRDAINFDILGFQVFDQNMKKEWGKEVKMPYTEKDMNNLAFGVLSSGNAFMIAQKNKDKKLELFTVTSNGLEITPLDISGDYYFMKLNLNEDTDGNLICAGLYSEDGIDIKVSVGGFGSGGVSYNTNGFVYFKMEPTGKILASNDYEFSLELIQQYVSNRIKKRAEKREGKGKAGIEDLKLVEMINQKDGSTVFVCERQYARNEMWGTDNKTVYHYYNIVIMKVDVDGNLVWVKKIPKNQAGVNGTGQMSIKYIEGDGYHYVLYVDNPKNLNISIDDAPATHKDGMGGFLTACKIDDETGKYEKHTVLDMRNIEDKVAHQFSVTRIYEASIEDQIFMMEAYLKGKKDAMIKIKLK